jgi:hypothetical protein
MAPAKPIVRAFAEPPARQRLSGRRLDLLDPSPLGIEIEDIAHGLTRASGTQFPVQCFASHSSTVRGLSVITYWTFDSSCA